MDKQTLFPDLTYSASLDSQPVQLDGQKVLFDKKVTLMPADLETIKQETHKNDNGTDRK